MSLFFPLRILAQYPVSYRMYGSNQGLYIHPVAAIAEDSLGMIWSGGPQGAQRFDGCRFKSFPIHPASVIRLFQTRDKNLWFCTYPKGIHKLQYTPTSILTQSEGGPKGKTRIATAIFQDKKGRFWKGNYDEDFPDEQGLFRMNANGVVLEKFVFADKETMRSQRQNPSKVNGITEDDAGNLWLSTFRGMVRFNPENKTFKAFEHPDDPNRLFTCIYWNPFEKCIYAGTWGGGLKRFNPQRNTWNEYLPDPKVGRSGVTNIIYALVEKNQELWIASSNGLLIFQQSIHKFKKLTDFKYINIPVFQNPISSIFKDRYGNIWAGTEEGLAYFSDRHLSIRYQDYFYFDANDGKKIYVHKVFEDKKSKIKILLSLYGSKLIVVPENGMAETWGLKGNFNRDISFHEAFLWTNNQILIQSSMGWLTLDFANKQLVPWNHEKYDVLAPYLTKGNWTLKDELLISVSRDSFMEINVKKHVISKYKLLYQNEIDPEKGVPLLLTHNYLYLADRQNNRLLIFQKNGNLLKLVRRYSDMILRDMVYDAHGKIYACTFTELFEILNDTVLQKISIPEGMPADKMTGMTSLPNGEIWIQTPFAILVFQPRTKQWFFYGKNEGLNISEPSISFLKQSQQIVIGSDYRTIQFPINNRPWHTKKVCDLYIHEIKLKDSAFHVSHFPKELTYDQNFIQFEFSAMDFDQDFHTKYKYRLKGLEAKWNMAGLDRTVKYSGIPPGNYQFEIMADDSRYGWISNMVAFPLIIQPPFWQTWWFMLFMVLIILSATHLIYSYRLKKIKEEQQLKLAFTKKVNELEMKSLRAQMNPHFIFNSLNTINSLIVKNDSHRASQYLTKFSRLVRQILDHSRTGQVTLQEELDSIRLYLQLESLRFHQKFSYKIEVPENMDTAQILLPAMIIQPYVENAIWHGLLHAEYPGELLLEISHELDVLKIVISDNGIGREASMKLKEKYPRKHKSHGMNITEERVRHIHPDAKVEFHNKLPQGTIVMISLPGVVNLLT